MWVMTRGGPLDRPASPEQPDKGTDPAGLAAVEQPIVYVAQLDDGSNVTLSPQEFRAKFGWQNDDKTIDEKNRGARF